MIEEDLTNEHSEEGSQEAVVEREQAWMGVSPTEKTMHQIDLAREMAKVQEHDTNSPDGHVSQRQGLMFLGSVPISEVCKMRKMKLRVPQDKVQEG